MIILYILAVLLDFMAIINNNLTIFKLFSEKILNTNW